jgi:hypothetical protein
MMGRQVTRQRLALGFPRSGTRVAAKSGSLLGIIRNEIGVITMAGPESWRAGVTHHAAYQRPRCTTSLNGRRLGFLIGESGRSAG